MQELGTVEDHVSVLAVRNEYLSRSDPANFILQIFKERQRRELDFRARNKAKRRRERMESDRQPKWVPQGQFAPQALGGGRGPVGAVSNAKEEAYNMRREGMEANRDAAKSLKNMLKKGKGSSCCVVYEYSQIDLKFSCVEIPVGERQSGGGGGGGAGPSAPDWRAQKRKMEDSDSEDEPPDEVRLYEDGFKNRCEKNVIVYNKK